jgi:hypothetical protein
MGSVGALLAALVSGAAASAAAAGVSYASEVPR